MKKVLMFLALVVTIPASANDYPQQVKTALATMEYPLQDCYMAGYHAMDEERDMAEFYRHRILSGPLYDDGRLTSQCKFEFNNGARAAGAFDK